MTTTPETSFAPEHKQANTDISAGEQFLSMIEERGAGLPADLVEKARTIAAAYDESMRVLSSPDEEAVGKATDQQVDKRDRLFAEALTTLVPNIIEGKFGDAFRERVSPIEVAQYIRETLGIPLVTEHTLRMAMLGSLTGEKNTDYALLKQQKTAGDHIRHWSSGAEAWFEKPFRKEAEKKAKDFIAAKKGTITREEIEKVVRDTYSEAADQKRVSLEEAMQSATEQIDSILSDMEKASVKRLGNLVLSKRKRWDRESDQGANVFSITLKLDQLARNVERVIQSRLPGLYNKFPSEQVDLEKGIKEVTDEVYKKYQKELKSGKLFHEYSEAIASTLTKQGLGASMTKRRQKQQEQTTAAPQPEARTPFSPDVVRAVDSEIAKMQAQGFSDRKIKATLHSKYHPDSGNTGKEEHSQYLSYRYRPQKTETVA